MEGSRCHMKRGATGGGAIGGSDRVVPRDVGRARIRRTRSRASYRECRGEGDIAKAVVARVEALDAVNLADAGGSATIR